MDLFSVPVARRTDPETSHEAAQDAALGASEHRLLVLRHLSEGAKTDYELATATGLQQNSIGKRRGECCDHDLVEVARDETGKVQKRKAPSGSMARVWRITPAGWDFYRDNAK